MIRITGGTLRNRQIAVPKGGVRPMPEKVRLALANSLSRIIEGKDVLDLFAGTGAMGFELLSRGAQSCTFVEICPKHASFIRTASRNLGVVDRASIHKGDAFVFPKKKERFDIIFLGPPFVIFDDELGRKRFDNLLGEIILKNTKEGACIVAQTPTKTDVMPEGITPVKIKKYGVNKLVYFEKEMV